jgi:hypothetical protein
VNLQRSLEDPVVLAAYSEGVTASEMERVTLKLYVRTREVRGCGKILV